VRPYACRSALRTLRNVTGLQTDGHGIAYPNASYKSLWWSPSPGEQPSKAVATRHLQHVDNSVQVSGRYVAFGIYTGVFVADTRLRRYVQVSAHGGSALVDSTDLLVTYGPSKKALHPLLRMFFVPWRDLPPMPACS
jgi:hypothetical protein